MKETHSSEQVTVSCQRLGTSGSVLPLNSKGELRQEIGHAPWIRPLNHNVTSPRSESAARGGTYRSVSHFDSLKQIHHY